MTAQQAQNSVEQAVEANKKIQDLLSRGFEIIYADEVMFTTRTQPQHTWSAVNSPLKMDYKNVQSKSTAVIAAISLSRGVELFRMEPRSINIKRFLVFLDALRRNRWADDVALFVDQLSVHRSNIVAQRLDELGIPLVLNAAYSPDFNPIENIFASVKRNFR